MDRGHIMDGVLSTDTFTEKEAIQRRQAKQSVQGAQRGKAAE
jgi:hypothetical protein